MANGHGGKRAGAGRPKKPLHEKILEGSTKKHKPKVIKFAEETVPDVEMPDWIAYYGTRSHQGEPSSQQVFEYTVKWLKTTGCLHLINPDLIMEYAIVKACWYEIQRLISQNGMAYTTDKKLVEMNPMIDGAMKYFKMTDMAWDKIWRIVAQNCEENLGGSNPHDDFMEKLLHMNQR